MIDNGPTFLAEHRRRTLEEHVNVGRHKPVSYLPISTIEKVLGLTISDYEALIVRAGNKCMVFTAGEGSIKSGAVYAYSDADLAALLKSHSAILSANGWPILADEFVRRIAAHWFDQDDPLVPVIKAAFGDN